MAYYFFISYVQKNNKKQIRSLTANSVFNSSESKLIYVSDNYHGILRKKKGKGFIYLDGKEKINDEEQLRRIKRLAIPPAWREVWICKNENGHLQATGFDARNRKQYRYHPEWNTRRNDKKFDRLSEFGKLLPRLRLQIEKDLCLTDLTQEKVLATVISVMERTYIRVGNSVYEKENGSYGLTTLKDSHIKISGTTVHISFRGKKGIHHSISLNNKKLARIVKQCRDIPGKELFQYYDEQGNVHSIDSGKVNAYIKNSMNADFTAKDIRTWAGSLNALRAFKETGEAEGRFIRKNIVEVLDYVSAKLGNTRAVCKKYYVHPAILQLYENNNLTPFLKELDKIEKDDGKTGLTAEEKILMRILEKSKKSSNKKVA